MRKYSYRVSQALLGLFSIYSITKYSLSTYYVPNAVWFHVILGWIHTYHSVLHGVLVTPVGIDGLQKVIQLSEVTSPWKNSSCQLEMTYSSWQDSQGNASPHPPPRQRGRIPGPLRFQCQACFIFRFLWPWSNSFIKLHSSQKIHFPRLIKGLLLIWCYFINTFIAASITGSWLPQP